MNEVSFFVYDYDDGVQVSVEFSTFLKAKAECIRLSRLHPDHVFSVDVAIPTVCYQNGLNFER